ncbi:hypothetical protein DTO013E5_327 [Penicillium roqueforti]|uniref:magnesium chelatase n=1 Tax=Penicillium roqueforti (strain FM164) TaxID=1365484 RepID=W6Q368_PENRF|nr:uncharacterized protein LCP9604111_811 [Penicillium roqueforti]CDM31033.1 unnamed protein product [Penicillium roqueforti FM164]KAF9253285.1 hypothetical protein LCP9604111_811 [Penicillium roqueforti]KAI1838801.1 hypothetical protein CBS147337_526 [Penicillium roqueforti]KAI2680314.1 hypothetical protein CBS147355_3294 [Penicillium roqueforti]KAI2691297.1 hypothetical protein LCP963914a_1498 [Penicillium roqueforti]
MDYTDLADIADIAQQLSDLEVALLLCLVAREHCLIETTSHCINDLAKELALIGSTTFNYSYCILDCSTATSIDDVFNDVLTPDARANYRPSRQWLNTESSSKRSSYKSLGDYSKLTPFSQLGSNVVNIVVAKNFNFVSDDIQMHMLQLMRSKELVTENGTLSAPEDFLFIPLVARDFDQLRPSLKLHLNDNLFISHFHSPDVGYTYLEENDWLSDGQMSASSVIHNSKGKQTKSATVSPLVVGQLRETSASVSTSAEVVRYIQDIVVFLRLSRAVAGGVSANANIHFSRFAQLLAPLHGIDYLTPSIVALAARKVFRHRIIVTPPGEDRSLQYGSNLRAVADILVDVTPDSILDGVLALEPPL